MRPASLAFVFAAIMLSGCAHGNYADTYTPVIDTKDVDLIKYQQDLAECRQYAQDHDPAKQALTGAIAGAVIGAALGAAVGASVGDAGYGAKVGTVSGAASGTGAGVTNGVMAVQTIVRNCMAERGYKVLY